MRCPHDDCSGHGVCDMSVGNCAECTVGWSGAGCHIPPPDPIVLGERGQLPVWAWILVAAGSLMVLAALSALLWRLTAERRRALRLFNSLAIAEKTAIAVAKMQLEELDYLYEIRNPSRIQAAFIDILTEPTSSAAALSPAAPPHRSAGPPCNPGRAGAPLSRRPVFISYCS
eukprot:gene8822-26049_t